MLSSANAHRLHRANLIALGVELGEGTSVPHALVRSRFVYRASEQESAIGVAFQITK